MGGAKWGVDEIDETGKKITNKMGHFGCVVAILKCYFPYFKFLFEK